MSRSDIQSGSSNIVGRRSHPEAYIRRIGASEVASERPRTRSQIDRIELPRRYSRSTPSASICQAFLDLSLIGGAQLAVMTLIYERLGIMENVQAISVIALSTIV